MTPSPPRAPENRPAGHLQLGAACWSPWRARGFQAGLTWRWPRSSRRSVSEDGCGAVWVEEAVREAGVGAWRRGLPSRSHLHWNGHALPSAALSPWAGTLAHTQAAPGATCAPPAPAHTDPSPPAVLGSQPLTRLLRAVSRPPLYRLCGRQLQPCPLLREQVDSEAQSHKPWVGTRVFFVSLSSSSPLCPLPFPCCLPLLSLLVLLPPTWPFFVSLLCCVYSPKFPEMTCVVAYLHAVSGPSFPESLCGLK